MERSELVRNTTKRKCLISFDLKEVDINILFRTADDGKIEKGKTDVKENDSIYFLIGQNGLVKYIVSNSLASYYA